VTIVNAVSENGSFINACNLLVATAIANPTAAPPKNTKAKCSETAIQQMQEVLVEKVFPRLRLWV
ncbi:MAG: hypothetical protein WBQ25_06730, partial [Nitrososphaeraceae archaeon]